MRASIHKKAIGDAFNALYKPEPFALRKNERCPLCHSGLVVEDTTGTFCSRRYNPRRPCKFETGVCATRTEFNQQVQKQRRS